jgi:hypothetical protein
MKKTDTLIMTYKGIESEKRQEMRKIKIITRKEGRRGLASEEMRGKNIEKTWIIIE